MSINLNFTNINKVEREKTVYTDSLYKFTTYIHTGEKFSYIYIYESNMPKRINKRYEQGDFISRNTNDQ